MSKDYFVLIRGIEVPVTEEVFRAFKRPRWQERENARVRAKREFSFDRMQDDGMELADPGPLVEEIVERRIMADILMAALSELAETERSLIDALFFEGLSERDYSAISGIPQKTINNRKKAILTKLKKFF